jgi:hypothetical protein
MHCFVFFWLKDEAQLSIKQCKKNKYFDHPLYTGLTVNNFDFTLQQCQKNPPFILHCSSVKQNPPFILHCSVKQNPPFILHCSSVKQNPPFISFVVIQQDIYQDILVHYICTLENFV